MDAKLKKKSAEFFSKFPRLHLKKGEMLLEPDHSLRHSYFLNKGYVRTFIISNQGVELTMHIFVPGSFFPMMDVLAGIKNQYFFETLTDSEVHVIPKDAVMKLFKQDPETLFDLSKRLLTGLDKVLLRVERLVFAKAEARVASTLLYLARHFGEKINNTVKFKYLFTHKDIAAFAGVSRETASREMQRLVKQRQVLYKNHLIYLPDLDSLKNLAGM